MKMPILIVDDDNNSRNSIAEALSEDYLVYTASNGREAIEILNKNKEIPIVLSDVIMPDMSGIDLLEKIHIRNRNTIVIMITGFTDAEPVLEAKHLGAHDYIPKPLDLDRLEISIKNALEKGMI
jgi:DNA-binding NtrC family response regulator